jgi:hypothetical protein
MELATETIYSYIINLHLIYNFIAVGNKTYGGESNVIENQ